ncbi:hypothetical protein COB87_000905 [Candidatus Wolfebacteria bacterium]|nr:hypothetical protein [Candidatus Wolfebacteria bacterium]
MDSKKSIPNPLKDFETVIRDVHTQISKEQHSAKYPLTFSLLATLGIAAVIYGFEEVVGTVPLLGDKPILIFFGGLFLLLITGRLYSRLQE